MSAGLPEPQARTVIISSVSSDAHTWNLVFLQLLVEELGFDVVNLGACVPDELLVSECLSVRPVLLVLSTVNGHGYQDALRVVGRLRSHHELAGVRMVVGGKLDTAGLLAGTQSATLLDAGFDAVFDDRVDSPTAFRKLISAMSDSAHELR